MINSDYESQSLIKSAIDYATRAHAGQTRKGSNTSYIEHPLEVAEIANTMTNDAEVLAAAVLHDTVEDTVTSIEDIRERFGQRVAKLVASDTENKCENLPAEETWNIRKQETIERLSRTNDLSEKIIVLADKLSNMRQLADDYRQNGDKVWEQFHQKNKDRQAWYYKSILEATNDLKEYDAWQECQKLIEEVFA